MIYCFDLDGTLCTHDPDGKYDRAEPFPDRIAVVNRLHDEGNHIVISTARGSVTGEFWLWKTEAQLREWGVRYHALDVGHKPYAHRYIDDRAVNAEDFFGGV